MTARLAVQMTAWFVVRLAAWLTALMVALLPEHRHSFFRFLCILLEWVHKERFQLLL